MYFFETMSIFLFLLLLGALFSPLLGGCFVLFLIFFILSGILVFLSVNFVWILLGGLAIYLINSVMRFYRWFKLPTSNEYLQNNPNCKLEVGISCHNCGSQKLVNHGLFYQRSKWRFYACRNCGTVLFRFNVL